MRLELDKSPRVLIVNGFADGLAIYGAFLHHHGMTVRGSRTPELALEVLSRFRPDVIVTDLVFQWQLDGHAFIQVLRQRRWAPNPVIVVVSGAAQPQEIRRARNAGADSFLIKPCFPERLLKEIEGWLEGPRVERIEHSIRCT